MGANLANEVAEEKFCETTIGSLLLFFFPFFPSETARIVQISNKIAGCKDKRLAPVLRDLIQTSNFRVVVVEDCETVEVCGALKANINRRYLCVQKCVIFCKQMFRSQNVVACAAGFVDGLGLGDNTKAAVIRLGLMEMVKFVDTFYSGSKLSTFFESCGVADLITTCYGGRNRRVCEQFVKTGKVTRYWKSKILDFNKYKFFLINNNNITDHQSAGGRAVGRTEATGTSNSG